MTFVLLVLDEELDVVLDGDAGLVAAGDDVAQTDQPLLHEVLGDRVTEPAALRDEPDRPGSERLGEVGAEGRHAVAQVEDAVAVRAADEQAPLGGQPLERGLARLADRPGLAEAARQDDRGADAALDRGLQESRHLLGRDCHHHDIGGLGCATPGRDSRPGRGRRDISD